MVLRIWEPELTFISLNLFNTSLKGNCFLDYWKVQDYKDYLVARFFLSFMRKFGKSDILSDFQ